MKGQSVKNITNTMQPVVINGVTTYLGAGSVLHGVKVDNIDELKGKVGVVNNLNEVGSVKTKSTSING